MYFWRINSLKRDLAAGAIGENEALPYLLWLGAVETVVYLIPLGELNRWDVVDGTLSVTLFLAGTWYAFRSNGGSSGKHFLVRYLTINWVLGIRVFVMLVVPGVVSGVYLEELLFEPVPADTTPIETAFLIAFQAVFYWRLSAHMGDVSAHSRAA